MKTNNTNLRLILSLGGSSIKSEAFEAIAASKQALAEFAESVTQFMQDKEFDGVEVDWRWPGQTGGSKTKDGLNKLIKVGIHHCSCIAI